MTAIVLSGEGAKGAFQAGVLYGLSKRIKVDALYGVSSGAINAHGFSYGGASKLIEIWGNIRSVSDIWAFQWAFPFREGLYSSKPLRSILKANTGAISTQRVKFPYLYDGVIYWADSREGYTVDKVLGACAIPGIVEPVYGMVDAGTRIICPLKEAIRDGHTSIDVILGQPIKSESFNTDWPVFRAIPRAYAALADSLHTIMVNDINTCIERNVMDGYREIDIRIHCPEYNLGTVFDFNKCKEFLEKGLRYEFDYS